MTLPPTWGGTVLDFLKDLVFKTHANVSPHNWAFSCTFQSWVSQWILPNRLEMDAMLGLPSFWRPYLWKISGFCYHYLSHLACYIICKKGVDWHQTSKTLTFNCLDPSLPVRSRSSPMSWWEWRLRNSPSPIHTQVRPPHEVPNSLPATRTNIQIIASLGTPAFDFIERLHKMGFIQVQTFSKIMESPVMIRVLPAEVKAPSYLSWESRQIVKTVTGNENTSGYFPLKRVSPLIWLNNFSSHG